MSGLEYANLKLKTKKIKAKRITSAFPTRKDQIKYWSFLSLFIVLGLIFTYGLLVYNNPVAVSSPSFKFVVKRRMVAVISMAIAASSQSLATVAFQTITNNRVITPSLLGFEALYTTINTGTMFIFGATSFIGFSGLGFFGLQVGLMVIMGAILYGSLLMGKEGDLQLTLLIGVIIGTGLQSFSSFMQKLLAPAEFDILQAKLLGSVNNADPEFFKLAVPLVLIGGLLLIGYSKKLNILSLGKDMSSNLGLNNRLGVIFTLILVTVLIAVSTALVGPMTFFGFLVASLTYELTPSYDHKYIFPMALAVGFTILTGAYFLMYHIFNAQGVVSVIIEMLGGITFLLVILRKGAL